MADSVKEAVQGVTNSFLAWPLQKRITMVASLGLGLAVLVGMLMYSQRQAMVPLLSNLSEEDAAQIVANLENERVVYELTAGGTAILVPEAEVYRQRLRLAGEGLPRGGNVGFELFDSPSFGMSRFAEQLNYRRGLEGELRRSIRQIDAIKDARVHIVVAEQSLFREAEKKATAAVTVHLRPGRTLAGGQVQAIVHLVASSVAGLSPDHVTLVDSSGHILAKGGEEAGGGASGSLDRQRAIERAVEERVHSMLAPVVGAEHVVVRASAALDFSRTDKTTESYDPGTTAVRSRQESEEKRTGPAAQGAQGIPGSRSNLTGIDKQSSSAPAAPGVSERRSSTSNFEINKVVAHEMGASGRLARLSVAVLVDGVEAADADGKKTFKERSPEELTRFEELARRAMGFDADREDQVSVQSILFGKQAEVVADGAGEEAGLPPWVNVAERFWPPLVALLAIGILGTVAWRARPQASSGASGAGDAGAHGGSPSLGGGASTVRELEDAIGRATADGASAFHLGVPPPDVMAKLTTRLEPKLAASVLKGWLNEAQ